PPGDVAALAAAIETVAADPEGRRRLAERSRAMARTLTWSRVAEPLVRFCDAPHRAADLSRRPAGEAVPIPLVDDAERARRMASSAGHERCGSAGMDDRAQLVAERDAAVELATTLQNMKVFRYTKWPRSAYGALLRLGRRGRQRRNDEIG